MVLDIAESRADRYVTIVGQVVNIGRRSYDLKLNAYDNSLYSTFGFGVRYDERCQVTFLRHSRYILNIVKLQPQEIVGPASVDRARPGR
jgi:hypothetical protein